MPLLSIVIPTHNRQIYAEVAVRKTHAVCPEAEIIVSDTSADEALRTALADLIETKAITYVRPDRPVDVVVHFEFALGYATGDYLMFIGDDDCVGPSLTEVARWAARNKVDAVISYAQNFQVVYYWPGVRSRYYGSAYSGAMFVNRFDGEARLVDPIEGLKGALKSLGRGLGSMPRAYHGLVSRELVLRIRLKYGALFGGVTPDIYSAALISCEAERVWQVDFPFCLPGGSPPSTAGTGAAGQDTSDLRAHAHTQPFKNLEWDPLIPQVYAPFTVWAYSLCRAVEVLDRDDLKPNYPRIYALVLLHRMRAFAALRRAVAAHATKAGWARTLGGIAVEIGREVLFQAGRFGRRLLSPRAGGAAHRIADLPSIAAAYEALESLAAARRVRPQLPDFVKSDRADRSSFVPGRPGPGSSGSADATSPD